MAPTPQERAPDSTLALLRDPYGFIAKRAQAHGSDVFEARIMLQPTLCMTGPDAARLFYDDARFQREGAAPLRLRRTLFGRGGVQGLDGPAHVHRKRMLLGALSTQRVDALVHEVEAAWHAAAAHWSETRSIVLFDAMCVVLTRAVLRWAGVPVREEDVPAWSERLSGLFMGAARIGPEHLRARAQRLRLEADLGGLVQEVRDGKFAVPAETALSIVSTHRDLHGDLLPPKTAAVELLNILRPTVAVAVYITHLAHALASHPETRSRLGDEAYRLAFVQEVRRSYPFFPLIAARVRRTFEWNGRRFPAGRRVLLDLYGTNRDPRLWQDPLVFDPDRFLGRSVGPFDLMPQGGGDLRSGHRCAGEEATIRIMQMALRFLDEEIRYDVPEQDLALDLGRAPALSKSGLLLANVRSPQATVQVAGLR